MDGRSAVEVQPLRRPGAFLDLQRRFYRDDPDYVPPLTLVDRGQVHPGRHPFFAHAEADFFVARRGRRPVGRISTCRDRLHDEFHGDRVGFFGHFEAADEAVAAALLQHACAWLRERGAEVVRGPVDLSTNYRCGLLIEGDAGPPFAMMPHNPKHYRAFLEAFGLRAAKDLLALHMTSERLDMRRLDRIVSKIQRRTNVEMRRLDTGSFDREVATLWALYNRIWEKNWGFVPMTEAEFVHEAKGLRQVLRPELTVVVEQAGEAIAFLIGVPDINIAIKACNGRLLPFGWLRFMGALKRVRRFRVITLGVLPEYRKSGLDAMMMHFAIEGGHSIDFHECEASWVLEDNIAMLRPLETTGARVYRRYRIFEKELG